MDMVNLFAGVGGETLGFQRAGFRPALLCDSDPECRAVLSKRWPNVAQHDDVKTLQVCPVDNLMLLSGGFPCQDISTARTGSGLPLGEGLDGARSGLWFEQVRLIEAWEPDYVVGENVVALRGRGLDRCLASLDAIGYDAEWHCVSSAYLGAPHHRDRIWIIAYPRSKGLARPVLDGNALSFAARTEIAELGNLAVSCGGPWAGHRPCLRMGDGVSPEPHRLKQLGNSSSPTMSQIIGEAIVRMEMELVGL